MMLRKPADPPDVEAGLRRPPRAARKLVEVRQRSVLERGIAEVNEIASPVARPGTLTRVCSWESSQPPKLADGVRILALVLADVARQRKAPVL